MNNANILKKGSDANENIFSCPGALLSGSYRGRADLRLVAPLKFFNPLSLIFLPALYGSAAILIHELTVRWQKGWPTVLLLGVAFGIVNEGLLVKSFFDTTWPDCPALAQHFPNN